jgi:hypothetical protein
MKELIDAYIEWLKNGIHIRELDNGWSEIITPFLNHRNDMIEIYAKKNGDEILLSDACVTITDLGLMGVDFNTRSQKRLDELNVVLNSFGVTKNSDNELIIKTSVSNFARDKHRFLQAIMSVDDMFILSKQKVENFFLEDVATFLDTYEIPYAKDAFFTGKSGLMHKFFFIIPKGKRQSDTIIRAINYPKKDVIVNAMFMISDTQEVREKTQGVLILNDSHGVSPEIKTALEEYDIFSVNWSERQEILPFLARA